MRYFLYKMRSDDRAPNGGDFMDWLYFYKWGRSETVTFRKRTPHFDEARAGDRLFLILDGLFIGDAFISDINDNVYIEGTPGPVQELDIDEGGITEYHQRTFGLLDRVKDWWLLKDAKNELSAEMGRQVFNYFNSINHRDGSSRSRVAVYDAYYPPAFFNLRRK